MITRVGLHVIFVFFVPFGTRDVEYSLVLSTASSTSFRSMKIETKNCLATENYRSGRVAVADSSGSK